jgi:pimeloyl-ACP methyl ester carboxylesterase
MFTVRHFIRGASVKRKPEGDLTCAQMAAGLQALRRRTPLTPVFSDDELKHLAVPTLLLIGAREIMYDPAQAAEIARRLIPGLQVEIIPGASHFVNSDQPDKVNDSMLRFL